MAMPSDYNEAGLDDEIRRVNREEPTDRITIRPPFQAGPCPTLKSRKLYRRKGMWMVRCDGYWCEVTGFYVAIEDPRVVQFRLLPHEKY